MIDSYTLIAVKFAIGILVMILQINILGKYEFSVNTPLNQIQNYVLGGIIGGIIYNDSISILTFIIVLLIWSLVVLVVKFLTHNKYIKSLVIGSPVLLIKNGEVYVENCVKVGLTGDQLMLHLRTEGIISTRDVKIAIMETNGSLTILDKNAKNPKFPLISNGNINYDVLELIDKDENWLLDRLHDQGTTDFRDAFLAEYIDGRITVVPYPTRVRKMTL
ncbi:DUF421 domain-containing protein [Alloscardovia omnicolens]|uniref:DUF421 domain-containing protein n=1 Tax=Alloscardovia omnicolens TaxID=419015 RepID=UPI003A5DD0C3